MVLDSKLENIFLQITSRAALSSSYFVGKNKQAADKAVWTL